MAFQFHKYSGTGNDFIVVDNRTGAFSLDKAFWEPLCRRGPGIGADGVLLVEAHPTLDFSMRYLNADGGEVSMCGNGARSISHFCHHVLKMKVGSKDEGHFVFMTKAGIHESWVRGDEVKLKLPGVREQGAVSLEGMVNAKQFYFCNTGVPHAVFEVADVDSFDVLSVGARVRYDKRFVEGANANFYEVISSRKIKLRTYERGVEGETLACGTGAVASAVCFKHFYGGDTLLEVETRGGKLLIELAPDLSWVFLSGEVKCVFKGETF